MLYDGVQCIMLIHSNPYCLIMLHSPIDCDYALWRIIPYHNTLCRICSILLCVNRFVVFTPHMRHSRLLCSIWSTMPYIDSFQSILPHYATLEKYIMVMYYGASCGTSISFRASLLGTLFSRDIPEPSPSTPI